MRSLAALCIATAALLTSSADAIKCFCDRKSCDDALICKGDHCLIGIRKNGEDSQLHQVCGDGVFDKNGPHCDKHRDGWQEFCKCDDDFCNTFAYLRSSLDEAPNPQEESMFTYNDQMHIVHSEAGAAKSQRSSLIVLLVIIPLSVGGLAVCLIFLNYHCKMC